MKKYDFYNKKYELPHFFGFLMECDLIEKDNIKSTVDGFFAVDVCISDILVKKNITEFTDADGNLYECSRFFDDWFFYAVPTLNGFVYSLFKMREQEFDALDGVPSDGDTPGVTVSFIRIDTRKFKACIIEPTVETIQSMADEIDKVVARQKQSHHKAIKNYFVRSEAMASYLIADMYTARIVALSESDMLAVPVAYANQYQQHLSDPKSAKLSRLPVFLEENNQDAGHTVCDHKNIFIKDPTALSKNEKLAILATHTGNVSYHSFAAEVEYHAKFLFGLAKIKIPFFGKSVYASAIRADMTIDDNEFEGPAPFYKADSRLVMRHLKLHKDIY